jgi:hypothetical protein
MDKSKLFHCLMVDGMHESFVMESLLKKLSNSYSVNIPKYYSYGPRKLNIVLTQFRCSATFLNYDLFKVNIISNPSCSCGAIVMESLQNGMIISSLFLSWYTVVLWMVGGIRLDRYPRALLF